VPDMVEKRNVGYDSASYYQGEWITSAAPAFKPGREWRGFFACEMFAETQPDWESSKWKGKRGRLS